MKKVRLLTLGLAMSLAFAQTAQASIYITPFGAAQVYQGTEQVQPNTSAAPETSTEEIPVVLPAASYSTKEPVTMNGTVQTDQSVQSAQTGTITELEKSAAASEISIPEIAAEGAILYDVTHDRFLFEKNADKQFYPASITKILTALLVLENAKLDETVTFTENAVTRLESGAVTLGLEAGDQVSVKDCLYGLMLKSANEVANGLAEHVGGTLYGFADMMNAKAKELGCTDTHFVNPNGLNNSDHYTTARDMAKIAKAAFANETLCKITSTTSYKFPATKKAEARTVTMGHKMIYESDSRYYDGIVGGKTGYTSLAGNTLVTCVERDGVRMIAVILKSRSTHYTDTKALFDYGYALNKAGILNQTVSAGQTETAGQNGGPGALQPGNAVQNGGPGALQPGNAVQSGGPGAVQLGNAVQSGGPGALQPGSAVQNGGPGAVQPGNTAQSGGPGTMQQPAAATAYHKWIADGDIWRFELADGTRLSNCLVTIDGSDYAFDTEGKMVTGWLTLGANWHYFGSSGAMIKGDWRQDGSLWFYLGENGAMVRNAWIDNQYYVGADGVWVQ